MPKPNPNNPCLNCTERWIDVENNKRCHDTCDKHIASINKRKEGRDYNVTKVDKGARVVYNKPRQNRVLAYMINEKRCN